MTSILIVGPPSSFAASILREIIFSHASHSPVIALADRETEGWSLRNLYTQWATARQLADDEPRLHAVYETWRHCSVAALQDAIREQMGADILSGPKLLIVRDLSAHDAVAPSHHWLKIAHDLSHETGAKVMTAANWGGRPRIPVEELTAYAVDDLIRIESGWDLKITLHPIRPPGEPLVYKGTISPNGYYLFDLQPYEETHG
jgi:hypothetical protein